MSVFRNLLMAQGKKSRMPSGYAELKWIQSTGEQFVNINNKLEGNPSLNIVFELDPSEQTGDWRTLFGCFGGTSNGIPKIITRASGIYLEGGMQKITLPYKDINNLLFKNGELYFNDEKQDFTYNERQGWIRQRTIFRERKESGIGSASKLYLLKMWSDDVLIRDFVPCLSPANEVGLFDLVEGKFYGSETSTPLIDGPKV